MNKLDLKLCKTCARVLEKRNPPIEYIYTIVPENDVSNYDAATGFYNYNAVHNVASHREIRDVLDFFTNRDTVDCPIRKCKL